MTGQMFIAGLALIAILVVLAWTLVDHARETAEPEGPVLFDRSGRLIGATEELPMWTPQHRARRWFR